jgi:hypothetical protein
VIGFLVVLRLRGRILVTGLLIDNKLCLFSINGSILVLSIIIRSIPSATRSILIAITRARFLI